MNAVESSIPGVSWTGQAARPSPWRDWLLQSVLLIVLAHQCGTWVRPAFQFLDVSAHQFQDGGFSILQKLAFLCEALLIGWGLVRFGPGTLLRRSQALIPFGVLGLIAGVLGFDPVESLRWWAYWVLTVAAAVVLAEALPPARLQATLIVGLLLVLLGSIALAIMLPAHGTQLYGRAAAWRGLMSDKNALGWVAAVAFCVACFMPRLGEPGWRTPARWLWPRLLLALAALLCLVASGSRAALLAGVAGVGLWFLLVRAGRRLSPALIAVGIVGCSAAAVALAMLNVDLLDELLRATGRDLTFTGRSDVWATYLPEIMSSPLIGQGPSAFTAVSSITVPLAHRLVADGLIFTPHSMYLATIGDAGVPTLLAKLGALGYFLYRAARHPWPTPLGAVTIALLIVGFFETREVYGVGVSLFVSMLAFGMLDRQERGLAASPETGR